MYNISKYKKAFALLGSVLLIVVAFKFSTVGALDSEVEMTLELDQSIPTLIKVHVVGAVVKEGVYELESGMRVEDAIQSAGGLLEEGNDELLNYARLLKDGEKITVLRKKTFLDQGEEVLNDNKVYQSYTLLEKINYMTSEEFSDIPGIGEVISNEITKVRDERGHFQSVEELGEVSGIGDAKLQKIIEFLSN